MARPSWIGNRSPSDSPAWRAGGVSGSCTVLFTDIVGSTEMAAELGDQGWRELVQEHNRLVRAAGRNRPAASGQAGDDGFGLLPVRALDLVDDVAPAQDVDRLVVGRQVERR